MLRGSARVRGSCDSCLGWTTGSVLARIFILAAVLSTFALAAALSLFASSCEGQVEYLGRPRLLGRGFRFFS